MLTALLFSCFPLTFPSSVKAQSDITNLSLTFHNYTVLLKDSNGSFCVYEGADGNTASTNPTQVNLVSQISGQQTVYGMPISYWSAVIIWATKLPADLHVSGTVNIRAFISSTFQISGVFSGGGYGMGLVDIDGDKNEVQEFITQAPYTQGGNPFTATPAQYSVSTSVDYTFKAGHYIGFAVGVGATTQGFSATVYFDSATYNSGATLPMIETVQHQTIEANAQTVAVISNSAIQNCQFNAAQNSIQFTLEGISGTNGFCNVTVPKTLMQSPFTVTCGNQKLAATTTENATHTQIFFTSTRSTTPIQITGEPGANPSSQPSATVNPSGNPSNSANPSNQPTHSGAASPTASPTIPEYLAITALAVFVVAAAFAGVFWRRRKKR